MSNFWGAVQGGCPYRLLSLCIQSIDRREHLRSNAVLGEDAGTINITSVLELETGTIDFNLREVRVGAGLCACPGPPRGVAPTGYSFYVFNQLIKEETSGQMACSARTPARSNSTDVLGGDAGTIGEILIAPVSSVRSLPVGPRARFDL